LSSTAPIDPNLILPLPWQAQFWQGFSYRIEANTVPHALMLSGVEGIGIERLARAVAHQLLCLSKDSDYPCGVCKGCQLLAAKSHPDFLQLAPSKKGGAILVDQIRELCGYLEKTAQQGGWKVALISPAESMNTAASNALLKNLEEPRPNTLVILVSHRLSQVPATVRSRCQIESLSIPTADQSLDWLTNVAGDSQQVTDALEITGGRPLLALEYIQGEGIEHRLKFEGLLNALRNGDVNPIDAAQQVQQYDADNAIEWAISYLHRQVTTELRDRLNPALFGFADSLIKARGWILSGSNTNNQLLWEQLFIEWAQIFQQPGHSG
jgi:DNA polymerase-3 subunit delta'